MSRLLLIVVAVLCLQWSLAAVVPEKGADTTYTLGECPVYKYRCLIACPVQTERPACATKGGSCCTKNCQCKPTEKCCQPACGCNKVCIDVTGNA